MLAGFVAGLGGRPAHACPMMEARLCPADVSAVKAMPCHSQAPAAPAPSDCGKGMLCCLEAQNPVIGTGAISLAPARDQGESLPALTAHAARAQTLSVVSTHLPFQDVPCFSRDQRRLPCLRAPPFLA